MKNQIAKSVLIGVGIAACIFSGCATLPSPLGFSGKSADQVAVDTTLPPQEGAKICVSTAQKLHENGDLTQAAAMLERGRSLSPDGYDYSRHLAILYGALDQEAKAEAEFRKALSNSPKDADLWNDYGYFQYRQDRLTEADASFQKALSIDSNHAKASMNLAVNLVSLNRLPEAYERFEKIVGPAAAHQNIGVLLAKQGRSAEARVAFENAIRIAPDSKVATAFVEAMEKQKSNGLQSQERPDLAVETRLISG